MKTFYINGNSNILVDTENNTADLCTPSREAISRVYAIKEPMHIVYGNGEVHCEEDAEPGDIVVLFYHKAFKNQFVVVKSEKWFENLVEWEKQEQEEKERWAAEKAKDVPRPVCGDCES